MQSVSTSAVPDTQNIQQASLFRLIQGMPRSAPVPEPVWNHHTYRSKKCEQLKYEQRRNDYLASLADLSCPCLFVISGLSGSGKSYVAEILKTMGIQDSQRLITRPIRESDAGSRDVQWIPNLIEHQIDNLAFAYSKNGNFYAVTRSDLVKIYAAKNSASIIVGDLGKLNPVASALDELLPLAPVVALQITAPLEVIENRLRNVRKEGVVGEAEQRIASNMLISRAEEGQVLALKTMHNLHTLVNLSPEELTKTNFSEGQLMALTPDLIRNLIGKFEVEGRLRARQFAEHMLRVRSISSSNRHFPNDLIDVLDGKLLPLAEEMGLSICLKGGCAVAAYLSDIEVLNVELQQRESSKIKSNWLFEQQLPLACEVTRPVSPDIDWVVTDTREAVEEHATLVEKLADSYDGLQVHTNKPIFNSTKLHGAIFGCSVGAVELDAIVVSRITPINSKFTYSFEYDRYLDFRHRNVSLPSGKVANLVAPELLIVEKLLAARGVEYGKLDLVDAMLMLVTQPIQIEVIQHLIERQQANKVELRNPVLTEEPKLVDIADRLNDLGIVDSHLRTIALKRLVKANSDNSLATAANSICPELSWHPDNLKKMAMLNDLLRGIAAIEANKDLVIQNCPEELTITQICGPENTQAVIASLRNYIYYYAEFQLGRSDTFIQRDGLNLIDYT